jgi:hypothetical protein
MDALVTGFALVGGGTLALAFVTESTRDLVSWLGHAFARPVPGDAGRRARAFWAGAGRHAVLLGALGAAFGFAGLLGSGAGPSRLVTDLGMHVLGPPILGLTLAALCSLPASRRVAEASVATVAPGSTEDAASRRWLRLETGLGYVLLAAVLAWTFPASGGARPGLRPIDLLLHLPAWLTVAAGAVAIALYLGELRRGRSFVHGFALAGAVGALVGLLQAFHGFSISKIETVAGGLVFSLSAAVAALVGLIAVGYPIESRAAARGQSEPSGRVAWSAAFSAVLLVLIVCVMVMTPMTAPAK